MDRLHLIRWTVAVRRRLRGPALPRAASPARPAPPEPHSLT